MSDEQLKVFLEAVKADAGLQEKLKAATDVDAVVAIAKAAGFAISADELKRAQAEVSEEELEGVAGGQGRSGGATMGPLCKMPSLFCTYIMCL
ncbi:hypothetical protein SynWH8101_1804 [Synechococcus sp. WH 8101]|uniref:Nif11-like leader peptide family RiPP precursor n=1 Tax=Synechococcus sp. WH 8101 TaxID=59932 RepID=UPI001023AB17|nr:Nif11-like leader peptide family RiPP precursor [Synechococcus sp. WH 8101]QBE69386.1 hypothetical protein SynWH8101_1804 [Synechococcus sp. WH 8101]